MTQTLLRLRDYQREAIDAVHKAHADDMQRPAVVLPTGSGKTVIFSHLAAEHLKAYSSRVVILVHRDELADQTIAKLRQIAPELKIGKVKAQDNETDADVMVCSVQTLARPNRLTHLTHGQEAHGLIGLVIVDECHHALAQSYQNIMRALGCFDSAYGALAVGFTATLARGDGAGLGDVWDDVVYTRSVLWMVSKGHLVDPRARQIDISTLDLGSVKKSGGDYSAKSLGDALMEAGGPEVVHQVIQEHAAGRRSILVFTPTVEVAQATAQHIRSWSGLTAGVVHGGTPRDERLALYGAFASGRLRVLVNCMVLTEGADFPYADCAVIARPTRSETLFIQMVGRVLRPSPVTGKTDALVLLLSGAGGSIRTLVDLEPGVAQVDDDESLAEAFEREQALRETKVPAGSVRFELKHKDLDLFGSSPAYQWLRTAAGVQFIPAGDAGEILLWPSAEPGLWDVVLAPSGRGARWLRLHTSLELSMAMAWAESEADEHGSFNTGRGASWRKKKPSEAQRRYAFNLGIELNDDMRAGDVGDRISIALTSRRVDRFVKGVRA